MTSHRDLESTPDNPSSAFDITLDAIAKRRDWGDSNQMIAAAVLDALGIPHDSESAFVSWAAGQDAYAAGLAADHTRIVAAVTDFAADYYEADPSDLSESAWFPAVIAIVEGDEDA